MDSYRLGDSMKDLKSTIDNTNTQKENIKTVATNIDNKLVELGGERATDLADVPNKIEDMFNKIDLKYQAKGTYNQKLDISHPATNKGNPIIGKKQIFNIPININFVPKKIILIIDKIVPEKDSLAYKYEHLNSITLYSDKHNSHKNAFVYYDKQSTKISQTIAGQTENMIGNDIDALWIDSFDSKSINFGICIGLHPNVSSKTVIYPPIEWIALG